MNTEDNNTQDPKGNPQYPNTPTVGVGEEDYTTIATQRDELPNPNIFAEGYRIKHNNKIYENRNNLWVENLEGCESLPDPKGYRQGDPVLWEGYYYRLINGNQWLKDPINKTSLSEGVVTPTEPELTESDFPNEKPDVGILARDLMEKKAEVKRLKRRRLLDRCIFWFVIMWIILTLGYFSYNLVLSNYETGRYNDVRECKISAANLTVTGKRTYSYPFKSLFGFRLIDESRVIEKTTVNVAGAAMTVMGLTDKRWWGIRIGQGDRNVQNLRQADTYTFATDKGLAVTTYRGFCQQKEQVVETDPKTQDSAIID